MLVNKTVQSTQPNSPTMSNPNLIPGKYPPSGRRPPPLSCYRDHSTGSSPSPSGRHAQRTCTAQQQVCSLVPQNQFSTQPTDTSTSSEQQYQFGPNQYRSTLISGDGEPDAEVWRTDWADAMLAGRNMEHRVAYHSVAVQTKVYCRIALCTC